MANNPAIVETGAVQTTGIDLTNCVSYFDGCNNCSVKDGKADACTLMYCETPSAPKCLEYATGVMIEDDENGEVSDDDSNIAMITLYYFYLQSHKFQQAHDMVTGATSSVARLDTLYGKVNKITVDDFTSIGNQHYKGNVDIEEITENASIRKYTYKVIKQIVDGKIKHVSSTVLSDTTTPSPNAQSPISAPREGKTEKDLPDLIISSVEVLESAIIENE